MRRFANPSLSGRLFLLGLLPAALLLTSCSDDDNPQAPSISYPTTASGWVGFVDWDTAQRVAIKATEVAPGNLNFTPSSLSFEAGRPYVIEMKSDAGNADKHYFHAPEFFKAVATRKAQTSAAEYKAPYFDDFELLQGGTLELYCVPVIAGTYELECTITGHSEAGMVGQFTITGGNGFGLDLEVASDFNTALGSDGRRSGSNAVWQVGNLQTQTVTLTEYAFAPSQLTLTRDVGYKLSLVSPATNQAKHYFTAVELYKTLVTRKAQDVDAEIKAPYFKAVELLIGGSTDLYIVPTVAGSYHLVCTVTGHEEAGMHGTVTVE